MASFLLPDICLQRNPSNPIEYALSYCINGADRRSEVVPFNWITLK